MGLNNMAEPISSAVGGQVMTTAVGVLGLSITVPQIDGSLLIAAALGSIVYTASNVRFSNWWRAFYGLISLFSGYIFGTSFASVIDALIERQIGAEVEVSAEAGAVIAALLGVYFVRGIIYFGENPKVCIEGIVEFVVSIYQKVKRLLP